MKTQKYIDKYCEYIDRLLHVWETENYPDDIYRIIRKTDFIARILQVSDFNDCGNMNWQSADFYKKEEIKRNQGRIESGLKPELTQAERLNALKDKIRRIKNPIKEIEAAPYKAQIEKDKLIELLDCLKYIKEVYRLNANSSEIDVRGRRANELVEQMGLISRWWKAALETNLISDSKLPYSVSRYPGLITTIYEDVFGPKYSDVAKKRVDQWIARIEKLLAQLSINIAANNILSPEVEPILINEEKQLVFDGQEWHRITPKALDILKKLNQNPGLGLTGNQLRSCPGSEERPDKAINTLPKSIRVRIKNTRGYGYHLV